MSEKNTQTASSVASQEKKASPWDTLCKGTIEVEIGERKLTYKVMSRELPTALGMPDLPGFVGRLPDGTGYFVSEDVPEDNRALYVLHEDVEFKDLADQPGRCVEALKQELALLPTYMKDVYLDDRLAFFERLNAFYESSDNESFKQEIAGSLAYLQDYIQTHA